MTTTFHHVFQQSDELRRLFLRGFLLILPLWAGAIPAGLAYGVAASQVGLSPFDTQLMSLIVFSAAGQISAVALMGEGSSAWLVFSTMLVLNVQLLLIGVTIRRQEHPSRTEALLAGPFITDAGFALSAATGNLRMPVLLGAGVSMYMGWNIGTALGLLAGALIPNPQQLGLGLIIPLAFLAVLAPQIRSQPAVIVVVVSAAVALACVMVVPGGVAVLIAGVAGSLAGAWALERRRSATAT